jgi:hypothetical protein
MYFGVHVLDGQFDIKARLIEFRLDPMHDALRPFETRVVRVEHKDLGFFRLSDTGVWLDHQENTEKNDQYFTNLFH